MQYLKFSNILLFFLCLFFSCFSFAGYGKLSMEDLNQGGGGTFSMISNEGQNVLNLHIAQDFKFNQLSLGAGLNLVLPENKRPDGLSLIEFRYIQYDSELWGAMFGRLSKETYGYGLVMDSYDSSPASTYFNMSKAGVKAYSRHLMPLGVYGMYAGTGIIGGRLTYDLFKMPGFNTPLVTGISFVKDIDGVRDSNNQTINQGVYGYAVDTGFKLIQPWMDAYVEYGVLSNQATGFSLGTKVDAGEIFDFRAEYRVLGKNFVMGLFNSNYEISPVNLSTFSALATKGYFVGAEVRLQPLGIISLGYESYNNNDSAIRGAIAFNEINGISGVVSYEQILQGNVPYKVSGTFVYPLNAWASTVVYYERLGDDGEPSYTVAYKMRF